MTRIGLVVAVVLLAAACSGSPGGSADDPAGLYAANCTACHAGDGSGGAGPALAGYTAGNMEAAIRNGAQGMPAYGSRLSDAEIDALVAFIQREYG